MTMPGSVDSDWGNLRADTHRGECVVGALAPYSQLRLCVAHAKGCLHFVPEFHRSGFTFCLPSTSDSEIGMHNKSA